MKLRGIEVVWDVEEPLPRIEGDSGRLEQVFINLLINARDAIEEKAEIFHGGEIEKRIMLTTKSVDGWVFCEVEDTGVGIPEPFTDKIFEPFFTTKEVGKGTGLGLSISYGIVKDCKGAIEVASKEGEGTRFVMRFPVRENG